MVVFNELFVISIMEKQLAEDDRLLKLTLTEDL